MKASKLIVELEKLICQYGDLDTHYDDDGGASGSPEVSCVGLEENNNDKFFILT